MELRCGEGGGKEMAVATKEGDIAEAEGARQGVRAPLAIFAGVHKEEEGKECKVGDGTLLFCPLAARAV